MLTIEEYKAEDGKEIICRIGQQQFPTRYAENIGICGVGFSFFWDGELLGCAGIYDYITAGTGEAWGMYSTGIGNYPIDPQIVRDRMNEIIKKRGYRKVRIIVRRDFPAGMSFLRYLGFTVEGIMKAYEPDGTDAFLYERVEIKQKKQGI